MIHAQHPLSAAFPAMAAEDFQALKDSIANIGVQNPVTLLDGMVLDGWHRYSAATDLGMDCPTVDLDPATDPRDFVLAQNKTRRHVTQAQLALATTAVYDWHPAHRPNNSALSAELSHKTAQELAAIAGVGVRSIEQAKAVQKRAAPEVIEAVKRGDVGLPKAAAISKLPQGQQAAALAAPAPKAAPARTSEAIDPSASEEPQPDDSGPDAEELAALAAAEAADRETLAKLLESDDKLATAHAEITRLNALSAQLQQRLNGLMNEKNEAVKQCKALQRQLDRARRGQAA